LGVVYNIRDVFFAKQRLEWVRSGVCNMRANLESLIEGCNRGDYTWESIGTNAGEIWHIASKFATELHPVTGNRYWVMFDLITILHPLVANRHQIIQNLFHQQQL